MVTEYPYKNNLEGKSFIVAYTSRGDIVHDMGKSQQQKNEASLAVRKLRDHILSAQSRKRVNKKCYHAEIPQSPCPVMYFVSKDLPQRTIIFPNKTAN